MSIKHSDLARDAMADAVTFLVDGGSLVLLTAKGSTVATMPLEKPAFQPSSGGKAVADTIGRDKGAKGGKATKFELRGSGGAVILGGSVGMPGESADLTLQATDIPAGWPVEVSEFVWRAPK